MYEILGSLLFRGTVNMLYWSGGNLIYIVTPHTVYNVVGGVYNWWYPPKTVSEKLIEELMTINKHLSELKESGVVIVDNNGNTKDVVIDNSPFIKIINDY